jgi:diguanylate cyclase (GGDEF)-like protein
MRTVNDAHGKLAGDRFLVESGRRIRASVRAADLAVRLGGDQLAVLLPMTPANEARGLAKRLARLLGQPLPGLDGIAPTWSVGVATLAPGDEDALGLLWRCDEARAPGWPTNRRPIRASVEPSESALKYRCWPTP